LIQHNTRNIYIYFCTTYINIRHEGLEEEEGEEEKKRRKKKEEEGKKKCCCC